MVILYFVSQCSLGRLFILLTSFSQEFELIFTTRGQPSLKNNQRDWFLRRKESQNLGSCACERHSFSSSSEIAQSPIQQSCDGQYWNGIKCPEMPVFPQTRDYRRLFHKLTRFPFRKLWRPKAGRHPWCHHQRFIFHLYLKSIQQLSTFSFSLKATYCFWSHKLCFVLFLISLLTETIVNFSIKL